MNDPMRDDTFDREIAAFLSRQANEVAGAPSATEMAARLTAATTRTRSLGLGITPQLAWIIMAGLLVLSLIGAMVVGAGLLRKDPMAIVVPTATPQAAESAPPATVGPTARSPYEAVFLRRDPSSDVLVTGIDSEGRERVIARLTDAWSNRIGPAPAGALSPSGLLAIPMATDREEVRWNIVDLLRPEATPIVIEGIATQNFEQVSYWYPIDPIPGSLSPDARAWWGPGDRLAIHWYELIFEDVRSFTRNYFMTFVDPRSGEATSYDIDEELEFRPYWAPDGSGIFVDKSGDGQVLRTDGTLAAASDGVSETSCKRLTETWNDLDTRSDGTAVCLSPDSSLLARGLGSVERPTGSVTVQASGESFDVVGRFAGWLEVVP